MENNTATMQGGAIFAASSAIVSLQKPTGDPEGQPGSGTTMFDGNSAPSGGAIFLSGAAALLVGPGGLALKTRLFLAADAPCLNFPIAFSLLSAYNSSGGSCQWDCLSNYLLDQTPPQTCISRGGPAPVTARNSSQARAVEPYCAPGCRSKGVADGVCDVACLTASCAWDLRDCWNANLTEMVALPGGLHGVKVRSGNTRKIAMSVVSNGDINGDLTIDPSESLASFGLTDVQHNFLSGGPGWLITAGHVSELVVSLFGAIDGTAQFAGDVGLAAEVFVRLGDRGTRDLGLDLSEAVALGVSQQRFRELDIDADGFVFAWELHSKASSDACGFARFTAVPAEDRKGKISVHSDALWGDARTCSFLIQPNWFYPAEQTPGAAPPTGDAQSTVSLYAESAGTIGRTVTCLGALVHSRWVLSSGGCADVRFASVGGGAEIEVEKVVVHPGYAGWAGGNDVALVMLKGQGAVGVPPVRMQEIDSLFYKECNAFSLFTPRPNPNTTEPTLWQETAQRASTLQDCSSALQSATGDASPPLTPDSTVCSSPLEQPCNVTATPLPLQTPPSPGTPLFLRQEELEPPVLLAISSAEGLPASCGEAPPSVYTLVPSVIQWIRSVSSDLGSFAPRGISVTVPRYAHSATSSVSVREAQEPLGSVGGELVPQGEGSCVAGSQKEVLLGRGSVVVDVTVGSVQQDASCSREGKDCVGVDFKISWSEVSCSDFQATDGTCRGPKGCVVPDEGREVCGEPECGLDMTVQAIMEKYPHQSVFGGLGRRTVSDAVMYACLRGWGATSAKACGAREDEFVCFKHYETDDTFEVMGVNSVQKLVKPKKAADMKQKQKKADKTKSLNELFNALRARDGAAAAVWWENSRGT